MINIYSNSLTTKLDGKLKISTRKRYISIQKNLIGKYHALLIKVNDDIFICENVTLVSMDSNIDVIIEGTIERVIKSKDMKMIKEYKKISKKIFNQYSNRFQFGLLSSEFRKYLLSKVAKDKYKILWKHKLNFKESIHD
ncbi:MAG: hypothetical protein KAG14_01380 [Mycoplasmataceae bacterium]|nr:hypothetical protein [Mycoplasmataceae bacterium]